MDTGVVGIFGGIGGALVGAPLGYFVQRFFNRPRIHIAYAETAYEDLISIPIEIQQNISRYSVFVQYIESQVRWQFTQRLLGNMFTREELRVVYDLGTHFLDQQKGLKATLLLPDTFFFLNDDMERDRNREIFIEKMGEKSQP